MALNRNQIALKLLFLSFMFLLSCGNDKSKTELDQVSNIVEYPFDQKDCVKLINIVDSLRKNMIIHDSTHIFQNNDFYLNLSIKDFYTRVVTTRTKYSNELFVQYISDSLFYYNTEIGVMKDVLICYENTDNCFLIIAYPIPGEIFWDLLEKTVMYHNAVDSVYLVY